MTLNEALTGVPAPEAPHEPESLREKEAGLEQAGMAKLNEMGKSLNLQAEAGAQEFAQETKSAWGRMKERLFRKKADAPVKGEAEILAEIEKSNQVYADFKKKYEAIMASGDVAGMRGLESDLSTTYEALAAAVAKEGADESKAWKKALKTGVEPEMTVVGAQLNDVARRLQEVRGRLGQKPPAEAPSAASSTETPPDNVIDLQAEREKRAQEAIRAGAEEYAKTFDPKLRAELTDAPIQLEGQAAAQNMRVLRFSHADFPAVTWMLPIAGRTQADIEDQLQAAIPKVYAQKMRRVAERQAAEQAAAGPAASPEEGTDENPILLTPEMRLPSAEGAKEGREQTLERARTIAEAFLKSRDADFSVTLKDLEVRPNDPSKAPYTVRALAIDHPRRALTWTQEVADDPAAVDSGLADILARVYEEKMASERAVSGETESKPETPEPPMVEAAPAEAVPETTSEKKEFPMNKLEAAAASVAEETLLPLAKAFDSPKTYGTKVIMKMNAADFLKLFTDKGKLSAEDAGALAEEFKTNSEEFNTARKKLANAINKLTR